MKAHTKVSIRSAFYATTARQHLAAAVRCRLAGDHVHAVQHLQAAIRWTYMAKVFAS
jgi:hypothetical protein